MFSLYEYHREKMKMKMKMKKKKRKRKRKRGGFFFLSFPRHGWIGLAWKRIPIRLLFSVCISSLYFHFGICFFVSFLFIFVS